MGADDRPIFSPVAWHLETERLVLNPFGATDAELYAELINERGPGARGFGTTVQGARDNIAKAAIEAEESGIGLLAVRRRTEGDFIGYCGLLVGRASIDEPEIAFELFRRAHGQGYATEAAVAVIEAAKATGRRRLWSTVGAWNHPSLRVLEKIGFRRDHTETDDNGDLVYLIRDL
jgi:RimJ/RimL family protein N-acetyltransferase